MNQVLNMAIFGAAIQLDAFITHCGTPGTMAKPDLDQCPHAAGYPKINFVPRIFYADINRCAIKDQPVKAPIRRHAIQLKLDHGGSRSIVEAPKT